MVVIPASAATARVTTPPAILRRWLVGAVTSNRIEGTGGGVLSSFLGGFASLPTGLAPGRRSELTLREKLLLTFREDEGLLAITAREILVGHGFLDEISRLLGVLVVSV